MITETKPAFFIEPGGPPLGYAWKYEPEPLDPPSWISEQAELFAAVEFCAQQGDVEATLLVAAKTNAKEMVVNRLLTLLPHEKPIFEDIRGIAAQEPKLGRRIELFKIIAICEAKRLQTASRAGRLLYKLGF